MNVMLPGCAGETLTRTWFEVTAGLPADAVMKAGPVLVAAAVK